MTGMGCRGLELESLTLRQMTGLYERFRTFISLEWSIDWSSLSLNSILRALCGKDQGEERKYVLILGTFHPNGYFRERCMEELAKESGALPYLMLRANDWVKPIFENEELLWKYLLDEQEDISKAACASLKACVPAKS